MIIRRGVFRCPFCLISAGSAGAFLGFALWVSYSAFVLNDAGILKENGLLETVQAIILALACLVYLAPIALEKRTDKLILLLCSLLCLSFVLRELDVEKFAAVPDALKLVGSGIGKRLILGAGFISILIYASLKFSYYKNSVVGFLGSIVGRLLVFACIILLIGAYFDKHDSIPNQAYYEEMSEYCGYFFIYLSAITIVAESITSRAGRH
jgi:hypothetical protein